MFRCSQKLSCLLLLTITLSACRTASSETAGRQAAPAQEVDPARSEAHEDGLKAERAGPLVPPSAPQHFALSDCARADEALTSSLSQAMRVDVELTRVVDGESKILSRPAIITGAMQPFSVEVASEEEDPEQRTLINASFMLWREGEDAQLGVVGELSLRGVEGGEVQSVSMAECVASFGPVVTQTLETTDGATLLVALKLSPHLPAE